MLKHTVCLLVSVDKNELDPRQQVEALLPGRWINEAGSRG